MSEATEKRSHWPISILSMISATFSLAIPLVLVRVLTPEEVGRFKIFFLYLLLAPIFTLGSGLQSGLSYFGGDEKKWKEAFHTTSALLLLSAVCGPVVVIIFADLFSEILNLPTFEVYLLALAIFGTLGSILFEDASVARGRIWNGALYHGFFEIVRVIAVVFTALVWQSLTAVLLVHGIIMATRAVTGYTLGYLRGYVGLQLNKPILKKVLKYAVPVSFAWTFGVFVTHIDQLLLSQLIEPSQFAIYTLGCLSIPPILILERSITRVLIPQIAEAFTMDNLLRVTELFSGGVRSLAFFIIPAVIGLVTFAEPIVHILFTPQYGAAATFLQIYAFYYLFLILPHDAFARARGDAHWILKNLVFCSIFSVGVTGTLAYSFGPFGALSGLLFSALLLRGTAALYMCKITEQPLSDLIPFRELSFYLFIALICALFSLLAEPLFSSEIYWFLTSGPLFAIFYLLSTSLGLGGKVGLHRVFQIFSDRRAQEEKTPVVLTVLQSVHTGGLERMVLFLNQAIRQNGSARPRVMVYDQERSSIADSLHPQFEAAGIPISLFKKQKGFSLTFLLRLVQELFRYRITILHCHDLGSLIYCVLAKILCFGRVTLFMTQHSFIHLERHKRYRMYERFFARFVDQLIVVSEPTRRKYGELGYEEREIALIPNGVQFADRPADRFKARRELLGRLDSSTRDSLSKFQAQQWILYMARLYPGKGQTEALSIWAELSSEQRDACVLLLVGPNCDDGYWSECERLRERLPEKEKVFMLGGTQVPLSWLAASDLYLSCSEYEGMPLGPLEALGSGLPAVLSDIPGHQMFLNYATFYPPGEFQRGAEVLESVSKRIRECDSALLAEQSRVTAVLRQRFSLERMVHRYESLYRNYCESYGEPSDSLKTVTAPV